jgi:hypothetical protein
MELLLKLPTMPPTVVLLTLTWIVSFRRNPSLMDGGNSRAWSGVVVILPGSWLGVGRGVGGLLRLSFSWRTLHPALCSLLMWVRLRRPRGHMPPLV